VEKKRAEERARVEAEERRKREAEEVVRRAEMKMEWRRWARRALIPPDAKDGVRITVRLPDGRRPLKNFSKDHTLLHLYAFVDVQSIPSSYPPESDPEFPPAGYEPEWDFQLASTYPRQEIPYKKSARIGEEETLKKGGNLIAETIRSKHAEEVEEEESDGEES